jgi:hypothetical protein
MTSSRPGKTLDRPIATKSSAFPVLLGLSSSRDVFLKRNGPVSLGSDISAAYRTGERRLVPSGSDMLAERCWSVVAGNLDCIRARRAA